MILELEHWYLGYSQILTDCRSEEGSHVLLLANADVDSVAAARIWSYMLRADGISYQLLPCQTVSQLEAIVKKCSTVNNIKAVVLLNLGSSRNLTKLFKSDGLGLDVASVKVYVADCRRPVHLANVHAGEHVVVFWDSMQNEDVPSDGDNLSGNESSTDEEEDDETDEDSLGAEEFQDEDMDEGEHEMDETDDQNDSTKQSNPQDDALVLTTTDYDVDYDGEAEQDEEVEMAETRPKNRDYSQELSDHDEDQEGNGDVNLNQSTAPTLTPRELHQKRRNRLRAYYSSGSFYGSPSSYVAYRVSTQLRFGQIGDLLWLACVGVTDAYLHARLDVAGYTTLAMDLRTHVTRLFPDSMSHRVESAIYAEHLIGNQSSSDPTLTKIGFSENGRILCETDFRFFLLRHSSLFEAMIFSDFLSTRLQLSTSRGMHKLQELLAKMGFPLHECQQPFAFMKPSLRRRLQEQVREHSKDYGLENFEFTSFFRVTGYQSLLSASDTSYAVTALFENAPLNLSSNGNEEQHLEEELFKAFNNAYDALNANAAPTVSLNGLSGEGNTVASLVNGGSLSGSTGLGAGIRLAMALQRNIMSTAASLIDRNAITRLSHFRYAYITCTSQAETQSYSNVVVNHSSLATEGEKSHVFAKPLALCRLAQYLMDLHRENGKWTGNKSRPLILMAEKPQTKSFMVVGYEYPEMAGHFVKNRFGKNFELAAQSMKGTFRFESFDSNVVEVSAADVQQFIEQLHYLMDSL